MQNLYRPIDSPHDFARLHKMSPGKRIRKRKCPTGHDAGESRPGPAQAVAGKGAEGATAPESLRPMDRAVADTLESERAYRARSTEGVSPFVRRADGTCESSQVSLTEGAAA